MIIMYCLRFPIFLVSVVVAFCSATEIPNIPDASALLDRIANLEKSMSIDKLAYEKRLNELEEKVKKNEDKSERKFLVLKEELNIANGMLSKVLDLIDSIQFDSHMKNGSSDNTPMVADSTHTKDRRLLQPVGGTGSHVNGVAFSVGLLKNQENLGVHQVIHFDHVITNVGSGFDPVSSIFKAPVAGLYFFNVVIMSHAGEDIETQIVKNGSPIINTYSGDSTTWNEGSQSTVLQLNVGDDVYIHIQDDKGVNDGNVRVYGGLWSSFSGFLISQ